MHFHYLSGIHLYQQTTVPQGRLAPSSHLRLTIAGVMLDLRNDDDRHIGFVKFMRDRTGEHLAGVTLRREERHRLALLELSDQLAERDNNTASLADVASGVLGRALGVELVGYGFLANRSGSRLSPPGQDRP